MTEKPKAKPRGKPFVKGQVANPGGRPKEVVHVRDLARTYTEEAIRTLAEIMGNGDMKEAARVSAAQALLDRGWGKPAQPVDGDGEGGPIQQTINVGWMTEAEAKARGWA